MKITWLTLRLDIQEAVVELLVEKEIISRKEIREKLCKYNNLSEEELAKVVERVIGKKS